MLKEQKQYCSSHSLQNYRDSEDSKEKLPNLWIAIDNNLWIAIDNNLFILLFNKYRISAKKIIFMMGQNKY